MHFKLIIALVEDDKTDAVMKVARETGATGSTIINQARGEGSRVTRTFLGSRCRASAMYCFSSWRSTWRAISWNGSPRWVNSRINPAPASHFRWMWRMRSGYPARYVNCAIPWRKSYE